MNGKPESKWAGEVFDSLRLFQRIGRSVVGLVLASVLWTLFMVLVSKLAPSKDTIPTLRIPWIHGARDVPIACIFSCGLLFVIAWWWFYSELYKCIVGPTLFLLRVTTLVVFPVVPVVVTILCVPLLIITWPMEACLVRRWLRRYPPDRVQQVAEKSPGDLRALAITQIGFDRWWLRDAIVGVPFRALVALHSAARIGFAPLISASYEEDIMASRAALQSFAWAINRARTRLQRLELTHWTKFPILPAPIRITTNTAAEMCRRFFACDILLWGSYVGAKQETIWLNIQQGRQYEPRWDQAGEPRDRDVSLARSLFPDAYAETMETRPSAFTLAQDDPWQAYTALLLSILVVVANRNKRPRGRWFGKIDRLSFFAFRSRAEIYSLLVEDAFVALPNRAITSELFLSTESWLTDVVSDWNAAQLDRSRDRLKEEEVRNLRRIAAKCVLLMPGNPTHLYRLGALDCLVGDVDAAWNNFKRAGELEIGQASLDPIALLTVASIEITRRTELSPESCARFAAFAARAINCADQFVLLQLRKDLKDASAIQMLEYFGRDGVSSIRLVKRMLADAVRQAVAKRAHQLWEEEGRPEGRQLDHWRRSAEEIGE
jgi:hypothetical protein